jgi:ankyrin repeat protein
LPIHLATRHNQGKLWLNIKDSVVSIVNEFPQGLNEVDNNQDLPLHIAIRYRGPEDMLRFLVNCNPIAATVKDRFGNLPLHLSLQFESGFSFVQDLLNSYPEACYEKNNLGGLPLHKACQFDCQIDILKLILHSNPSACSKKDARGNTPIHLSFLCSGGPPSEEKLKVFLQSYPICLNVKNHNNCTPFMMMNKPDENVVEDYIV